MTSAILAAKTLKRRGLSRAQDASNSAFDSVEDVVAAISAGEMVIIVDDEDRENEGDLIMAASLAWPTDLAFMVRHTSGILCTPLSQARAKQLNLPPMVAANDAPLQTAFTVSVDCKHGTSTGISAEDRTATVRALANPRTVAEDLVRPGHVFPLIAREGGTLVRAGHTEAAIDLCELAGVEPVGLIGELVNDDGSVQRLPQLRTFAREHGLRMTSIAELIRHRLLYETLVSVEHKAFVESPIGRACRWDFRNLIDGTRHSAFVFGEVAADRQIAVRVHRTPTTAEDIVSSEPVVMRALEVIEARGEGILLNLHTADDQGRTIANDSDTTAGAHRSSDANVWREVGVGAQILRMLGVGSIELLSPTDLIYRGLQGFGLRIDERTSGLVRGL